MTLRIGKIDYLNIWHVFHLLERDCPESDGFQYRPGHPSELNRALNAGLLDVSPSSSFEYLLHAGNYHLLPDASISAEREVQSVLFLSPVPLRELPAWLEEHPGPVCLTGASATSSALLRVLWHQHWDLPPVPWREVPPGTGVDTGRPFLEIGNLALRHFVMPPPGYHIYDLASEWAAWTGLPFVFAVWIARRDLSRAAGVSLSRLGGHISRIIDSLPGHFSTLAHWRHRPDWLDAPSLLRYWESMSYGLGPREQAALLLFGERCTRQGLLPGTPGLTWFSGGA